MASLRCSALIFALLGFVLAVNTAPFNDAGYDEPTDEEVAEILELLRMNNFIDKLKAAGTLNLDGTDIEEEDANEDGWMEGWSPMLGMEEADPALDEKADLEANSGDIKIDQVNSDDHFENVADVSHEMTGGKDDNQAKAGDSAKDVETDVSKSKPAGTSFKTVVLHVVSGKTVSTNEDEMKFGSPEMGAENEPSRDRGSFADFMKAKLEKSGEDRDRLETEETDVVEQQSGVLNADNMPKNDEGEDSEQLQNVKSQEQAETNQPLDREEYNTMDTKNTGYSKSDNVKDTAGEEIQDVEQAEVLKETHTFEAGSSEGHSDTHFEDEAKELPVMEDKDSPNESPSQGKNQDTQEEQELQQLMTEWDEAALSKQLQKLTDSTDDVQIQEGELDASRAGDKQETSPLKFDQNNVVENSADSTTNDLNAGEELDGEAVKLGGTEGSIGQASERKSGQAEELADDTAKAMGKEAQGQHFAVDESNKDVSRETIQQANALVENENQQLESLEKGDTRPVVDSKANDEPAGEISANKQDANLKVENVEGSKSGLPVDIQETKEDITAEAPSDVQVVKETDKSGAHSDGEVKEMNTAGNAMEDTQLTAEKLDDSKPWSLSKVGKLRSQENIEIGLTDHEIVVQLKQFLEKMNKALSVTDPSKASEDKSSRMSSDEHKPMQVSKTMNEDSTEIGAKTQAEKEGTTNEETASANRGAVSGTEEKVTENIPLESKSQDNTDEGHAQHVEQIPAEGKNVADASPANKIAEAGMTQHEPAPQSVNAPYVRDDSKASETVDTENNKDSQEAGPVTDDTVNMNHGHLSEQTEQAKEQEDKIATEELAGEYPDNLQNLETDALQKASDSLQRKTQTGIADGHVEPNGNAVTGKVEESNAETAADDKESEEADVDGISEEVDVSGDKTVAADDGKDAVESEQQAGMKSKDSADKLLAVGESKNIDVQTKLYEAEINDLNEESPGTRADMTNLDDTLHSLENEEPLQKLNAIGEMEAEDKTDVNGKESLNDDDKTAEITEMITDKEQRGKGISDSASVVETSGTKNGEDILETGTDELISSTKEQQKTTDPGQLSAKLTEEAITGEYKIDDSNLKESGLEIASNEVVEGEKDTTSEIKETTGTIQGEKTIADDQLSDKPLETDIENAPGVNLVQNQEDSVQDKTEEGASKTQTADSESHESKADDEGAIAAGDSSGVEPSLDAFEFARCNLQATTFPYTMSADGNRVAGQLVFKQKKSGGAMDVKASFYGLATEGPMEHAIDVHEFGDLSNACDSTGERYTNAESDLGETGSLRDANGLGNVRRDETGSVQAAWTVDSAGLVGDRSIVGRAIVVHALSTGSGQEPEDAYGARLACCVVARSSDVTPWI